MRHRIYGAHVAGTSSSRLVRKASLAAASVFAAAGLVATPDIGHGREATQPGMTVPSSDHSASDHSTSWETYGRTYANTRFSPLTQINSGNVGRLKLAFTLQLGALRSNEATPIVIGDTMYVSSSWGPKTTYALDARTGDIKWAYRPDLPDDMMQYSCCDVVSRGVSYDNGKIFVGRLDGYLVALDAKTGQELWKTQVVDYKQGSVITSPPVVLKGRVITGFAGGEYGVRGALQAYDENTGKQVWKTWLTATQDQPNGDSWKGDSARHGGAAAWNVGSYDAATDTLFWGTSNASPWNSAVRSTGTVDYGKLSNLYTASTVALDPASGHIKWWFQGTPQDVWDYDGVNENVLADLKENGQSVPALMKADRDGFFFVVNRNTGKLLSADPYVPVTWAKGYDIATARPIADPDKRPALDHPVKGVCPSWIGGKNWQPMSFNPMTGLVYVASNNMCFDMKDMEPSYHRGVFYLGADYNVYDGPGGYRGELAAWDPVHRRKAWEVKLPLPFNGGTMTTAGNLVFFGDITGNFRALDARTGKTLWKIKLGSGIGAGAMTYAVAGKQYVAVVVGRTATLPAAMGDAGKKIIATTPEGGSLFVFALGS
ncbi:PQQ-dependent dehydrogenase, methanol/ethanol family [Lichenicoccus roseus]|nr:PQQ-dependent dehydrogenase, methanol/ethanol family [Lichenicoccus roseus]